MNYSGRRDVDSRHKWLLAYWTRARENCCREVPSRSQIDLDDFGRLQRNVILIDLIGRDLRQPQSYRFRRIGQAFAHKPKQYELGQTLQSIESEAERFEMVDLFSHVVLHKSPQLSGGSICIGQETYLFERVTLPLSDDGQCIDMILTSTILTPSSNADLPDLMFETNAEPTFGGALRSPTSGNARVVFGSFVEEIGADTKTVAA